MSTGVIKSVTRAQEIVKNKAKNVCYLAFMACARDYGYEANLRSLASYPVPFRGGKEKGLVSTVCACARFVREFAMI